jgi:hypothetical protein
MNYSYKFLVIITSLFFSFSCTPPSNYKDMPSQHSMFNRDKFFVDPLVFYDTDSSKTRLDLYYKIPVEKIIFIKNEKNDKYESKLIISVILKNANNEQIFNNNYNVSSAFGEEEMKKNSKEAQYYFYNYYLEQGKFKLDIKITDENAKTNYKKSFDLQVKDFSSQKISFSDLMLLSHYRINEDSTKEITPLISNNIFALKEFFIFFEIYNAGGDSVTKEYVYKIKEENDVAIKEDSLTYLLTQHKNPKTIKISLENELKKYVFEESDFEFFPAEKKLFENFKIEIIDKANSEIVASKKLLFYPNKPPQNMHNKLPMH